jgi:hypothetical protein
VSPVPRYLLSVHGPAEPGDYPGQEVFDGSGAFNERLRRDAHLVFAGGLAPATTATTVDGQGDQAAFTDGPYLRAQECLGGFWVIEAADLDVALALAVEGSKACRGMVEVRPFRTDDAGRARPAL